MNTVTRLTFLLSASLLDACASARATGVQSAVNASAMPDDWGGGPRVRVDSAPLGDHGEVAPAMFTQDVERRIARADERLRSEMHEGHAMPGALDELQRQHNCIEQIVREDTRDGVVNRDEQAQAYRMIHRLDSIARAYPVPPPHRH